MSVAVADRLRGGCLAILVAIFACSPATANTTPEAPQHLTLSLNAAHVQVMLQTDPKIDAGMRVAYAKRNFAPIWVDSSGPTSAGLNILRVLKRADRWGLDSAHYNVPELAIDVANNGWTAHQVATAELAMSKTVLRYARDARGARIPNPTKQLASYIDRKPMLPNGGEVLNVVAKTNNPGKALLGFHPQHEQFQRLQKVYAKAIGGDDENESLPDVPQKGPMLHKGKRHADVAIVRERLKVPVGPEGADYFDNALLSAVKSFQSRSGLRADGYVGKRTRRAFAGKARPKNRLESIQAAMEQWRWMPKTLGERYIMVNIPEYKFAYHEHGQVVHEERVIVGTNKTQTPLFSDKMQTIVLRPEWYMPDSIKLQKLVSARRRGRTLESMGYRVKRNGRRISSSRVRWGKVNISAYTVYQPSGSSNALGMVKFLFPNKHAVYLHDTPSKGLFSSSTRTFSHGCIRVRQPLTLAQMLLDRDRGAGEIDVKRIVLRGKDNVVYTLENELPVHIVHLTVWVDDDGRVRYLKDTYGHEKRTRLALKGKWKSIDRGKDHLAAVDTSAIEDIQLAPAKRQRPRVIASEDDFFFPPPMGATRVIRPRSRNRAYVSSGYNSRPRGTSVGDIIRRSFGY